MYIICIICNKSLFFLELVDRLNSFSWVRGRVVTFIKPSVAADSFHYNNFTLKYTRTGWLPLLNTGEAQQIDIEPVRSKNLSIISTNVPNPSQDFSKITIGEDVTFQRTISLPVSTNANFIIRISGQRFEGVAGRITRVGNNIQSLHGQIRGAGK